MSSFSPWVWLVWLIYLLWQSPYGVSLLDIAVIGIRGEDASCKRGYLSLFNRFDLPCLLCTAQVCSMFLSGVLFPKSRGSRLPV